MPSTYQIVLSVATFSIPKITALNPNGEMLLYLFPADKEDTTMIQVHADRNLRLSYKVVPLFQFFFVTVDVVNHQHTVIMESTFIQ